MKTPKPIFFALMLCFISSMMLAQTAGHKTYDYVTIVADHEKPNTAYVSNNGEKYEAIELAKAQGRYDYNEVIKVVKKYEKEGYELFTSNMYAAMVDRQIYFLLRKEHKE